MTLEISVYDSDAFFADTMDEWDELLTDSPADQVFLTFEWLSTWWKVYAPGQVWALVFRDAPGRLQGLAPWFRTIEANGTRLVRPIGCVDVTDYLDVIVRAGQEEGVFDALAGFLTDLRETFDEIRLCNIPAESAFLRTMPGLLESRGMQVATQVEDVCPVIRLPTEWPEYLAKLDKKNRHELRRKLRRIGQETDWYIANQGHNLQEEVGCFLELMAASNSEKAAFLENSDNRNFFELVMPKLAERGWLQLAFLTVGGNPAASYLNFVYRNRVMVYNSGHDPKAHGQLSPGIVLLARLIEHAIAEGREVFDFLRGDEPYKYDMGGEDTDVFRMTITPFAGE